MAVTRDEFRALMNTMYNYDIGVDWNNLVLPPVISTGLLGEVQANINAIGNLQEKIKEMERMIEEYQVARQHQIMYLNELNRIRDQENGEKQEGQQNPEYMDRD
ncbi:hypothetical protein RirG_083290 [Rhizophagus irregularis DAOM 197198w]|uniref:BTB domain-containing protein n=1 Tax=Rhizophagus irregularis (strain DAOM 197198w) TaxID=1432141 RepID=A0A015MVV4_RHIIW|nr:hypothetical protein RirG_083290 [Rhizophagus irregularis DAOM 197198w]